MKRTKLLSLPTVPAAAHINPPSNGLSPLRAIAGFFVWVFLSGLGSLAPTPSYAATPCGGVGQRACCVGERIPSCNAGLHEVAGCTGNCTCGGLNPGGLVNSIGHCEAPPPGPSITSCGGIGQRACCVTERIPSCNQGLIEVAGCRTGDCRCGGANPGGLLNSLGHCEAPPPGISVTPCGGIGQRACCVTERIPSCNQGLREVPGCTGNCMCGGASALNSLGHCEGDCPTAKNNLTNLNNQLTKLNAEIAAANQAVQQQCAQQVAPAVKQDMLKQRQAPVRPLTK